MWKNTTYRSLLNKLIEIPCIGRDLGLVELPTPSTLCNVFNRLDMNVWRVILTLSDVTSDKRCCLSRCIKIYGSLASKYYTKRAELTIQQLKVAQLIDT